MGCGSARIHMIGNRGNMWRHRSADDYLEDVEGVEDVEVETFGEDERVVN